MCIRRTVGLVMAGVALASTWLKVGVPSASAVDPTRHRLLQGRRLGHQRGCRRAWHDRGQLLTPAPKELRLTLRYGSFANAENCTTAAIKPSGGTSVEDHGWCEFYAGQVYTKAPGKCIHVYGTVGGAGRWLRSVHRMTTRCA